MNLFTDLHPSLISLSLRHAGQRFGRIKKGLVILERSLLEATIANRHPDMVSASDFAASLDLSRETVRKKTLKKEILALRGAKQGQRFPSWQVTSDGGLLPQLPKLFERLGGNSWTVYRFLLQHHPELDGATAVDALKAGKVEKVLAAAENAGRAFS